MEIDFRTVKVFISSDGKWGNELGIALNTSHLSDNSCQEIAESAGYSETVYIDDFTTGRLRIFTPKHQLNFAGYPTVGAAWLMSQLGSTNTSLRTDAGVIEVEANSRGAWVEAPSSWSQPWRLVHLPTPAEVESASELGDERHDYLWAWIDPEAGRVRARAFTSASGSIEDEATGSAAMCLADELNRPLEIHQGRGSVIRVEPRPSGVVRLSGLVALGGTYPITASK